MFTKNDSRKKKFSCCDKNKPINHTLLIDGDPAILYILDWTD